MNTVRPRQYPQANGNYRAKGGETTDQDGHNQNAQDQRQQHQQVVARGRAQDMQSQGMGIQQRQPMYSPAPNAYLEYKKCQS